MRDPIEKILESSKKPKSIHFDDRKEFVSKGFADFLQTKMIKRCNRYTSKAAVFADCFK